MSDGLVLVTADGAVATITINRPDALNTPHPGDPDRPRWRH